MIWFRPFLLSLLAALLGACATPYQEARPGNLGGYVTRRVSHDMFQIAFLGNADTDAARVKDFALLRAAEVTLQNGFRYFVIRDTRDLTRQRVIETSSSARTAVSMGAGGRYRENMQTYGLPIKYQTPGLALLIQCFAHSPGGDACDAEAVKQKISARYDLRLR